MNKSYFSTSFLVVFIWFSLIALNPALAGKDQEKYSERCKKSTSTEIIDSKIFTGKLDYFEWGDYLHSTVRNIKGESESFFNDTDDSCFMAIHKGEELEIEYDIVCEYINEGGGFYPVEKIRQIKARKSDFKSWKDKFNISRDHEACEKEVGKYTH